MLNAVVSVHFHQMNVNIPEALCSLFLTICVLIATALYVLKSAVDVSLIEFG